MLEQLRKSGASIAIYLIFGLLIIIFVINFAPNAGQGQGGCSPGGNAVITVGSSKANQSAYHVAYAANKYSGRQKVYAALEMMIRRELLAQAAAENGIRITKGTVEEEIKKGNFFFAGFRIPDFAVEPGGAPQFVLEHTFFDTVDNERFFNIGKFKGWVNALNVSVGSYYDEQTRAMEAALMSEMISDSVRVSRDEALADFLYSGNTVTYDTVTFAPTAYRDAMRLAEADVARYLAGHEADVKKKYTDDERTYKATKPAYRLRAIRIDTEKPEPTPEAPAPGPGSGAGSGAGSGSAAGAGSGSAAGSGSGSAAGAGSGSAVAKAPEPKKPEVPKTGAPKTDEKKQPTPEEGKAKLQALRDQIAAKKLTFADAAKANSNDDATKWNGGDMGWKQVEAAGLGDQAINDAVKAIKPGEMTPVVVGESAVWLVLAEDKREGDLSYDQVKNEIAAEQARETWGKEAAKRAALDAFKASREGNAKNLGDMFERGANPVEQRRQMQQMIEQQMGNQHGAIEAAPAKDTPAAWRATEETGGSGGGTSTGSAAPKAGSAAPAEAPKAGSAAGGGSGSAAPAAGSGAGSGSAAGGTGDGAPTATPPAPLAPSTDVLPTFGELKKPRVIAWTEVQKDKEMPGLTLVPNASTMLFDELSEGMLGKQVYETPEGFVLLQLTKKNTPKADDFDKVADKEIARLRSLRGRMAVESWLKTRCEALAKDNKIKPMADLVRETDDAGKPLPQVYRPCMSFRGN